jgi:flagellar assembly factor FliW
MKISTTRFGDIEVDDSNVITVLGGIIGFENYYRFVILDFLKDSQFRWLQSLNDPEVAFVICDPWYFFKDYNFELSDEYQNELEIESLDDIVAVAISTIPADITKTTLNLISPIIINLKKMIGKQVILYNSSYSTTHRIVLKVKIDDEKAAEELKIKLQKRIREKAAEV